MCVLANGYPTMGVGFYRVIPRVNIVRVKQYLPIHEQGFFPG